MNLLNRLSLLLVCTYVLFCYSVEDPVIPRITSDTGWFVDTTGRISKDLLAQLDRVAIAIKQQGFQIAGAFFSTSERTGIEIATEFGNSNGIGYKDKDNGIAIVVFLDKASAQGLKPSISVAVGRGLEGLLNDAKIGRFLDQTFVPARKEEKWEQGLIDFAAKVHRYLKNPKADEFKSDSRGNTDKDLERIIVFIIMLLITIIALVINSIVSGPRFPRGPRMPGGGGFGGGFGGSSGGGGSFGGGGASRYDTNFLI